MVGFVLSGSGNRGPLQVGALQALLERNVRPDILVGTSAGAVNAAYLAARPTLAGVHELAALWTQVTKEDTYPGSRLRALWRLLRSHESLYSSANLRRFFQAHIPPETQRFGDITGIQLYIVAVCLETGKLRLFGDDPVDALLDALMSSTALPPFWPPWRCQEGELCIDGGLVANLPVSVALAKGANEVYALHATARDEQRFANDVWTIGQQALTAMLHRQNENDLQRAGWRLGERLYYIELVPPRQLPFWDFSHAAELIESGYRQTTTYLESRSAVTKRRTQRTERTRRIGILDQISGWIGEHISARRPIMQRPMWRILLDTQGQVATPLNRVECFALLEFLVDEILAGCDPETLKPMLDRCLTSISEHWPGMIAPRQGTACNRAHARDEVPGRMH